MLNVKDFGALGDGTTDDILAFDAAIAAMSAPSVGIAGKTLFVPTGIYRMSRSLHITRPLTMVGEGGAGAYYSSALKFDQGVTGVIVDSRLHAPDGGAAYNAVLRDFAVITSMPPERKVGAFQLGAYVRPDDVPGQFLSGATGHYYERTRGGTTKGTNEPKFVTASWEKETTYAVGDLITAQLFNGYYFRCTSAHTSGAKQPLPGLWKPNSVPQVGDLMVPPGNIGGMYYRCLVSGQTAPNEPPSGWPTTPGAQVMDGMAKWTCELPMIGKAFTVGGTQVWSCDGNAWGLHTFAVTETWQASRPYTRQDRILAVNDSGYRFKCIVEGASGTTEPAWPKKWSPANKSIGDLMVVDRVVVPGSLFFRAIAAGTPGGSAPTPSQSMKAGEILHDGSSVQWRCEGSILGETYRDGSVTWRCEGPSWEPVDGDKTADGDGVWTCRRQDGFVLYCRARLENVHAGGFMGHGCYIEGNSSFSPFWNANCWFIGYSQLSENSGSGLHVLGIDANAGVAIGLLLSSNGLWGVDDASFLGNTYVGIHTASNGAGPYLSESAVAKNTFVGCYSENDQNGSYALGPAVFVGGLHAAKRDMNIQRVGFDPRNIGQVFDTWCSPITATNPAGEITLETSLGVPGHGMAAQAWAASSGLPSPDLIQLCYNRPYLRGLWSFLQNGTFDLLALTGAYSYERARVVLPSGYQLGTQPMGPIYVSVSPRMLDSGFRQTGDRHETNDPGVRGYLARVCTRSGTAAPAWVSGQTYNVNDVVVPPADNGLFYTCIVGGKSGSGTPFPTAVGSTFSEGPSTPPLTWQVGLNTATVPPWGPGVATKVGYRVRPTTGVDNGCYYHCVKATGPALTESLEPAWQATFFGQEVPDGDVIWRYEGHRSRAALFCDAAPVVPPNYYRIDTAAGSLKVGSPLLGDDLAQDPGRRGYLTKPVAGLGVTVTHSPTATVTLLPTEYIHEMIMLTGALTENINVILPALLGYKRWIHNNTTGPYKLTVKTPAGTGKAIAQGQAAWVMCDGANILRMTPDAKP